MSTFPVTYQEVSLLYNDSLIKLLQEANRLGLEGKRIKEVLGIEKDFTTSTFLRRENITFVVEKDT